jgi:hypothetical protein
MQEIHSDRIHCNFDKKRYDSSPMVYSSTTRKMLVLKLPPVVSSHIVFCSLYRKDLLDEINKMLLTNKKDVMP